MRLKYIAITVLQLILSVPGSAAERDSCLTIYVSKSGDDRWSDLLPAANPEGSDGPVSTLDRAQRVTRDIRMRIPASNIRVAIRGQRYLFLNILEEIDTLGEWSLDEGAGLLYFWPPDRIGDEHSIFVSMLKDAGCSKSGTASGIDEYFLVH